MNILVQYLELLEEKKVHLYEDGQWKDNLEFLNQAFKSRCGEEPETEGINICEKVFIIEKDGKKYGFIIMDTQGAFDLESDIDDVSKIFAISTILSSYQIYNIQNNIASHHLEYLNLFCEYGRQIKLRNSGKPFQSLLFLLRDWTLDGTLNWEGGERLLKKIRDTSKCKTNSQKITRERLNYFENLKAFLMPHPGRRIRNDSFENDIRVLQDDFISSIETLVPQIIRTAEEKKDICGNTVTGARFPVLVQEYYKHLNTNTIATPEGLIESADKLNFNFAFTAFKTVLLGYCETKSDNISKSGSFVDPALLEQEFVNENERALEEFNKNLGIVNAEEKEKFYLALKDFAVHQKDKLFKINDGQKTYFRMLTDSFTNNPMALVVGTGGIGATLMGGLALAGEVTAAAMFGAPVVAFSAAGVTVIAATSYIKGTFATIAEKIPDMPAFLKRKKTKNQVSKESQQCFRSSKLFSFY